MDKKTSTGFLRLFRSGLDTASTTGIAYRVSHDSTSRTAKEHWGEVAAKVGQSCDAFGR